MKKVRSATKHRCIFGIDIVNLHRFLARALEFKRKRVMGN